jgi:hypothetical protein
VILQENSGSRAGHSSKDDRSDNSGIRKERPQ